MKRDSFVTLFFLVSLLLAIRPTVGVSVSEVEVEPTDLTVPVRTNPSLGPNKEIVAPGSISQLATPAGEMDGLGPLLQSTGTTTRVSVASDGTEGNAISSGPSISADGRYVAFYSDASNLVPGDTNASWDVFVHDRETGETARVSVASDGTQGNSSSG